MLFRRETKSRRTERALAHGCVSWAAAEARCRSVAVGPARLLRASATRVCYARLLRASASPVPGEGRVRRMRRTPVHGSTGSPQRSRMRSVAESNSPADEEQRWREWPNLRLWWTEREEKAKHSIYKECCQSQSAISFSRCALLQDVATDRRACATEIRKADRSHVSGPPVPGEGRKPE
jgi:hypothetical protein